MASEIRVDKINSLSGVGTVTLSPTGVDIAGITTAATLRATTGIVTSLTAGSLTSLGDVDIADTIVHTGDTNTKIRFPAADTVTIETGGSERIRVTSDGHFGIGDTTPAELLTLRDATPRIRLEDSDTTNAACQFVGDNASVLIQADTSGVVNDSSISFAIDGGEVARLDSSGRLLIGLTAAVSLPYTTHGAIQTRGAYNTSSINIINNESSGNTSALTFNKIRGSGAAGGTDAMGGINWGAYDGSAWRSGATLEGKLTSIGSNAVPSKLIFKVNSGSSNTERFAITPNGVTFNGDTVAANALDDYEEGTWTPDVRFSNHLGEANQLSYHSRSGYYTKVGNTVTIYGFFNVSSLNSKTGNFYMFGLPHAPLSSTNPLITMIGDGFNFGSNEFGTTFLLIEGGNNRAAAGWQRETGWSYVTNGQIESGGMYLSGFYYV